MNTYASSFTNQSIDANTTGNYTLTWSQDWTYHSFMVHETINGETTTVHSLYSSVLSVALAGRAPGTYSYSLQGVIHYPQISLVSLDTQTVIVSASQSGASAEVREYEYDTLGRLLKVKNAGHANVNYQYDAAGNRKIVEND